MPRADGSIVIDTKILEDGFRKGVSGLASLSKTAGKAIGVGIAAGTAALTAFAVKGVGLASDLQEVQNVVDTTFGKNAEKVNAWAKSAGDAFGLSELAAKKYSSTLGAMMKSQGLTADATAEMSTKLAGLAGDFASFYNLDTEEAFEKIRAGISGESEPLKQLGIDLSETAVAAYALEQGIKKPYSAMSAGEKTIMRYGALLAQSKDAQGDFAKTSDSFANQQRILSLQVDTLATSFGSKLLPALTKSLGGIMGWLDEMGPAFDQVFGGITKLMTGEVGGGLELSKGLGTIGESLIEGIGNVLPGLIQGFAALIVQLATAIIPMMPVVVDALLQGLLVIVEALPILIPLLITALQDVIMQIVAMLPVLLPLLVDAFVLLIVGIADALGEMAPTLIPVLIVAIAQIAAALIAALPQILAAAMRMFSGILAGLQASGPALIAALPGLWAKIVAKFKAAWPLIVAAAKGLFSQVGKGFEQTKSLIVNAAKAILDAAVAKLQEFGAKAREAGKDLVAGIWNGITDKFAWLVRKLKGFVDDVTSRLKSFFGIKSPSRLFEDEIGVHLGAALGTRRGFGKGARQAFAQMRRSVDSEMGRFSGAVVRGATGGVTTYDQRTDQTIIFQAPVRSYPETLRAVRDVSRGLVT